MNEQQAFGAVVRAHRKALAMSQDDLAEASGLHRTYIGSVERGERNISLRQVYAIASGLGTTAGELLRQADQLLDE